MTLAVGGDGSPGLHSYLYLYLYLHLAVGGAGLPGLSSKDNLDI